MSKSNESQRKRNAQRVAKWALYALLVFIAFSVADLGIIYFREHFLPNQAPPKKTSQSVPNYRVDRNQYNAIINRNLFSSRGEIPDPLRPLGDQSAGEDRQSDTPVLSNLPITLIGTLVHSNPNKSVAAVEVKSKNISASYMVGAEIEGLARVEAIQRGLLYFRNLNNGVLEYVELNSGNNKVSFDQNKPVATTATARSKDIQSLGNNTFKINRSDLDKHLNDLSSLLMQARAVPNRDPNTGEINGYRLVDYQEGSIFSELGIPRGAVIEGANGENVRSVQDAMGMFNKMKTSNTVKLDVIVNGVKQTYTYEITK